ncbi:MAG: HlyD family secretion protein, partial [Ruminiclostridium sp.]
MRYYIKRKYGVLIRIAILAAVIISGVALYFAMPAIVRSGVKKVDVIFPQRNEYTPSISCGGSVGFSQLCDIKEDVP